MLKVLISYKRCARITVILIDSHGLSTQAGTHAVSLTVVIYALLLGGQHRKIPATYYHVYHGVCIQNTQDTKSIL